MRKIRWIWLFFTALLILTARVNVVNAEAVVGGQIDIYAGEGDQTDQSAAFDSISNRFLVVWNDNFSEETSWDVYGQLINSDGSFYGSRITISAAEQIQGDPKAAFDPVNQRFLVLWEDNRGGQYEIYGRFVDTEGNPSGDDFIISQDSEYEYVHEYKSNIVFDPVFNRFFVTMKTTTAPYQLYGRFVNSDGSLGDYFKITNRTDYYGVGTHRLSYDTNNNRFLIVYSYGEGDILGILLDADGQILQDEFIISDTGQPDHWDGLASTSFDPINNRFLTAWVFPYGHSMIGQLINSDGSLYSDAFTFVSAAYVGSGQALIFDTNSQRFMFIGGAYINNGPYQIFGQLLYPDGKLLGSTFTVDDTDNGHFFILSLSQGSSEAGYLVNWSINAPVDKDIFGRTIKIINSAPVLNPIGGKEATAGELLTFEVSGYDLEEDPLSITSPDLPQGATLVDHANGTAAFSWTPQDFPGAEPVILDKKLIENNISPVGQIQPLSKKYNVTFKISGGEFTDEETIIITVRSKRVKVIPYPR